MPLGVRTGESGKACGAARAALVQLYPVRAAREARILGDQVLSS